MKIPCLSVAAAVGSLALSGAAFAEPKAEMKAGTGIETKRWRCSSRRRTPAPGAYSVTTVTKDNTALGEVKLTVE